MAAALEGGRGKEGMVGRKEGANRSRWSVAPSLARSLVKEADFLKVSVFHRRRTDGRREEGAERRANARARARTPQKATSVSELGSDQAPLPPPAGRASEGVCFAPRRFRHMTAACAFPTHFDMRTKWELPCYTCV